MELISPVAGGKAGLRELIYNSRIHSLCTGLIISFSP
jgi:hypothetical protein